MSILIALNLQLFAEGSDGAAAAGTETAGVTVSPTEGSVEGQSSPDTEQEDRQKSYSEFKAKYKSEYDADIQTIVKDRLKNSNKQISEAKAYQKSVAPIMNYLAKKYGVDPSDAEGILKAFDNDDKLLEDEAYDKGMTVEQLKAMRTIERENASLKAAAQEREEAEANQARLVEIDRQIAECQAKYPTFDADAELQNPTFNRLVSVGVPIATAYEVAHKDEIMSGAMQYAVNKAAEKVTNAVTANKSRPSENGLSGNSAAITKTNISSLSREQIADFKRRAAAGERITHF